MFQTTSRQHLTKIALVFFPLLAIMIGGCFTLIKSHLAYATSSGGISSTLVAQHSKRCLDVSGNQATAGLQLEQWDCNNQVQQSFLFQAVAGQANTYNLITSNNLCIDVSGISESDGAAVIQWSCNGQANQEFRLQPIQGLDSPSIFQLVAVHSGKCLDVSGADTANGAEIIQWGCLTNPTQQNQYWLLNGFASLAGSTTAPPPSSTTTDSIAQAVFNAINQSRASAGLPALAWSTALMNSAHQHNMTMAAANQMSHQLPGEADFGTRERQQGVNWMWAAENIGENSDMTQQGALVLHNDMMAEVPPEDGHRQNILTTTGKELGVDIVLDTQNHLLWLTEDFAAE